MLGYAAMNHTLRDREPSLRCNRDMRKKTWEDRGRPYASELAVQNFRDLRAILEWNVDNGIRFYRVSSTLVPWNSQFELSELPDYEEIRRLAEDCGALVREHGMRLTFHPDYWCRLASTSADTRRRSKRAIEYHADWLDLLGLDRSPYYGVNVHIGATYGDEAATAERFRAAVGDLTPGARARLTVENDDEPGLWTVPKLVEAVAPVGVPVVFDYHHHSLADGGLTYREAFAAAADTWDGVRPAAHYSEPARLRPGEDGTKPQAHAEYVYDLPAWLHRAADVMIEAGGKERALFDQRAALDGE